MRRRAKNGAKKKKKINLKILKEIDFFFRFLAKISEAPIYFQLSTNSWKEMNETEQNEQN